jgi:hypothetical protein
MTHAHVEVAKNIRTATVSNYHKLSGKTPNKKATRKLKSLRVANIRST